MPLENDDLKSLAINLVSSAICFMAGFLLSETITLVQKWRRPRFWSEIMKNKIVIVVGTHENFETYEASGMMGTGDALALAEFISFFRRSNFSNFEISRSQTLTTEMRNQNLLLIGGADANSTSRAFLARSIDKLKTKFGDADKGEVHFELNGTLFMPERGDTIKDAAAIAYVENPFAQDRHVLLVSGCFGFGTEAAARMVCQSELFANRTRNLLRFEAAISCEVLENAPTATELKCLVS